MLATVTEDPLMLPWDAVGKATAHECYRKSRYSLAFAGYLDPKLMLDTARSWRYRTEPTLASSHR